MNNEFSSEESLFLNTTQQKTSDYQLPTFQYWVVKRAMDLVLSIAGLIISFPLLILIAIVVHLTSPGPIFYREYRLGLHGVPFLIWKFRTMYVKEEQVRRLQKIPCSAFQLRSTHKLNKDPRITFIGKFLRRWSIDELPQIINVIKGEMSLIGPRPIVDAERNFYNKNFNFYCMVRPGMSGLWQVSGRSKLSYAKRVELDCQYVQRYSLTIDFFILAKTFYTVASTQGSC
jgi:lipopolysaccharide/colanic/teichoic acid biosynthesis glycosyltransferase